jgi:transcriptional regulator with XRE-family HTH domain
MRPRATCCRFRAFRSRVSSTTHLGDALRGLRLERRASLVEVAAATGISKSFLSLVENGRSDITIGRLLRLVDYYGAGMADLFPEEEPQDPIIVKRDAQREVPSPAEGIRVYLLAPSSDRAMNPTLGVIERGGASAEKASHGGEEFLHMLEGLLELSFGDADPIVLEHGDSAYFKAERPHSYRNIGEGIARFLTVSSQPTS